MPLLIWDIRRMSGESSYAKGPSQYECDRNPDSLHFFLYPIGQIGLIAVTVLIVLPLMQVIVAFLAAGFATADCVGVAAIGAGEVVTTGTGVADVLGAGASWLNFTLIVGFE
jgi:hypothetical protein